MEAKTKAVIGELIRVMEEREELARKSLAENDRMPNDRFMAGWVHEIDLTWQDLRPDGGNEIDCSFEYNGSIRDRIQIDEVATKVDLKFLTTEIFKDEIVPALQEWMDKKVLNEPFGGFYDANCYISLTLHTSREVRADDPHHLKGRNWERSAVKAVDEKRIAERRQRVRNLIVKEEYKSEDINEYSTSWINICTHLAGDFLNEFGKEKVFAFFEELLEKKGKYNNSSLIYALANAADRLLSTENDRKPMEDDFEFACELCILILQHGEDKYEKASGADYLNRAAEMGYKKAKDILKFGTGQISQDIVQYKDELINCLANDIEKVVNIKIKEESAAVYRAVVEYLTRLLENGFPGDYNMKFNSKVKNYIPTELRKTKMNNFFANAAGYPEVYEALKEYARTAFDSYNYYSDAEDEEAVTCGGYAAMALALADPKGNLDIGLEFLAESDFEHAITSRYFVEDFIELLDDKGKKKVQKYLKEF